MNNIWKRSLSMFLAVVMVIGMLPMNVFATEHVHTPVENVTSATCTTDGSKVVTCLECGEVISSEVTAAPGHSFVGGGATCDNCSEPNPNYQAPTQGEPEPQNNPEGDDTQGDEPEGTVTECVHEYIPRCATTCDKCGKGEREPQHEGYHHSDGAWDCTAGETIEVRCKWCGILLRDEIVKNEAHEYNENFVCTVCGTKMPESEITHVYDYYGKLDGYRFTVLNYVDGIYTATITDVKADTYNENKVRIDKSYDDVIVFPDNGTVTVAEDNSTVIITFNPETKAITVDVQAPTTDPEGGNEEGGNEEDEPTPVYVAKIGEQGYATLAEAIEVGGNITLLQDIVMPAGVDIPAGKSVVLDLAGYDITMTVGDQTSHAQIFLNYGNLTITDSAATDGEICLTYTGTNNEKVTISTIRNYGVLNIAGGTINCVNGNQNISYAIDAFNGGAVNISGGTVKGGASGYCIRMFLSGTTNTNTLNVTGGEVGYVWAQQTNANANKGDINITGGKVAYVYVDAANGGECDNSNVALNVKADCVDYAPHVGGEGYVLKEVDGVYTIVEEDNTVYVAQIGGQGYETLQAAIDAAKDGDTIILQENITENVTLTEQTGLYYTIDGAGKTMTGTITINSLSDTNDNRRITIKNIKFVDSKDANVDFISSVNTNHYPRITVEGCSFTGSGNDGDVAVRLKSSHSVVIKDCTGTGLHSFLQNTSGWNLTIENVTVTDSKGGLALGTVQGVTVKGSNITTKTYGVRLDAQYNNNAVIESNTVNAFIPVVVRKAEVDSTLTFSGTNAFTASNTDGLWCAIGTSEYEENGKLPTAPKSDVKVVLNDTGLAMDGVYGEAWNGETISSVDELLAFARKVNAGDDFLGKTVTLTADIDLTGVVWTPIGSSNYDKAPAAAKKFAGTFDGGNHTITGLSSVGYVPAAEDTGSTEYSFGLFGYVYGANIKNVKFADVKIDCGTRKNSDGVDVYGSGVAALIGYYFPANNKATVIENCHVLSGTVKASNNMGGLIGHMDSQISQPKVDITIANCSNAAAVTTEAREAGGILGLMNSARKGNYYVTMSGTVTFKNCSNTGAITSLGGGAPSAGGILGRDHNQASGQRLKIVFDNCTNSGLITVTANGETHAAGIAAGYYSTGAWLIANDCSNTGNIVVNGSGDVYAGGLISYGGVVELIDSTSTGTVTGGNGNKYVGGAQHILFLEKMPDCTDEIKGNTYHLNGGTSPEYAALVDDAAGGGNFHLVETAYKNGIEFLGWYTNPELTGEACTALVKDQKHYYAKWNDPKAAIGDKTYASLDEALAEAKAGDTITLLADVTEDVVIDKNLTINGASAKRTTTNAAYTGTITISGDHNVTIECVAFVKGYIVQNGANTIAELTIKNCSFTNGGYAVTTERIKKLTIEGCTVTGQSLLYAKLNTQDIVVKNVTITGGNYVAHLVYGNTALFENVTATDMTAYGICTQNYGAKTITLKNCSFEANENYYALAVRDDRTTEADTFIFEGTNSMNILYDSQYAKYVLTEGATLTAPEGHTVTTNVEGCFVKYVDGKYTVQTAVAQIGDTYYATLAEAFKAATSGCTIDILDDVIINEYWDARYTGAKFTVPVTINGNDHTIKFTDTVYDGGNFMAAFRFEADATVKNLTMDLSEAKSGFGTRLRAISAKANLTVENCTFIGNGAQNTTRAIIFGESQGTIGAQTIAVTDSIFTNWGRGLSDNENGKDTASSVTATGNIFTSAGVNISAAETVTFTGNTVTAGYVDIRSYSADNVLSVTATDNTLTANTDTKYNYIYAKTVDAQAEFVVKNPPFKVSTKAELDAALAAAKDGDTIILTADIDYGTTQLAITKAITLNLGGKTLTTRNAYGGMSVKGNPTIKNGTIVHASNTSAIKVWNAAAFEDLVIDVQGKGDANKTIGGIVVQNATTVQVGTIKNVTIKGAALTNGIETYNCGDATQNVIGSMDNVTIDAKGTGMLISAPCGTATNCSISGGKKGIEIWIKGTYSASLNLVGCTVTGGVDAHDEYSSNPSLVNNGTLKLTADEATTGAGEEDITLTIARAEAGVQGVLKTVMDESQAKVNDTYYLDFTKAMAAVKEGDKVTLLKDVEAEVVIKTAITLDLNGKTFTGKLVLADKAAALTAAAGLPVETNITNCIVVYENGVYKVISGGTWGGIDWTLTEDGTLTIAPTKGTPTQLANRPKSFTVGQWPEAVRYNSKGEGVAIEGWPYNRTKVTKLVIEEGVTSIGSFAAQSFTNLTGEVVIPSTVTYIGQEAFQKSTFTKLTFAKGGTEELCIAQGAFKNLIIEEVALPDDRPVHLHAWVFNNCHNLKRAYLPATLVSVHGTNHIDYFKDFNAHSNPTWTKSSEIFAYNENMESITFGSEEVRDMFFANNNGTSKDYTVANVGLTTYCDLQAAVNAAAANGGTVKLIKSITLTDTLTIPAGKEVTLDLNGKTISQSKACTGNYNMINNKGNLTITGNGKISFTDTGAGDPSFGWGSYTIRNEGTLVVENGTIEHLGQQNPGNGQPNVHMYCAIFQYSGSTTIKGGTISTPTYRSVRLWKGDMTINGGTFDGQVWVQCVDNTSKLTINGGEFSANGNDGSSVFVSNSSYTAELAVTGGTFDGKIGVSSTANLTGNRISGGVYTVAPVNALLADGYEVGYDNSAETFKFKVNASMVASVDGVSYVTLKDAIEAAKDGGTIYMMRNAVLNEKIEVPANAKFTLNLKGYTVNGSILAPNAEMTILNGSIVNKDKGVSALEINAGKLTLTNVNIDSARHALRIDGDVEATIEGGIYRAAQEGTGTGTYHAVNVSKADNVTIVGGTFVGPKGTTADSGAAVNVQSGATVTIKGGDFSGGKRNTLASAGTLTVVGGTFDQDPSAFVAEGFKAVQNADKKFVIVKTLKGSGTQDDPYQISNIDELILFRDSVNAGETTYSAPGVYVALTADIDMSGVNWVGIGSATAEHGFMGNFDGKGFKIKNLTITNPDVDSDGYAYAGLFAVTEGSANAENVIKNLIIENVTISTQGAIVAAAIAYPYYTTVDNVTVCGNIAITGGDYTSGVLAYTRRCVNASNLTVNGNDGSYITGAQVVGGVISDIQTNGGLIANYSNFSASGVTITGTKNVGGISGIITNQTLNGATVKNVALVCSDARVGTVSGSLGGPSTISNVTVENVTGATAVVGATYDTAAAIAAQIGDTYYATFDAALEAANAGDVITMLVDLAEAVTVEKAITLDLNGKNITGSVVLADMGAKVKAAAGLKNITTNIADHKVVEAQGVYSVVSKNYTVQIATGEKYETLAEAIKNAAAGSTVTFLADLTENVTVSKNVTIDGAGKTYTGKMTLNKVDVTIENVNFVKGSVYKNKKTGVGGNYTIKNSTFDGQGMNDYAVNLGGTNAIIIEGVTAKDYGYGFLQVSASNTSVSLKNVEISGVNYGIKIDYSNGVTLENVKISDTGYYGIYDSNYGAKTYTIKNSTLSSIELWDRETGMVDTFAFVGQNTVGALEASEYVKYVLAEASATLTAPKDNNVTTSVNDSKVVFDYKDDTYKVVAKDYVVQIGEVKYESLAEAFDAAVSGDTVTVIKDFIMDTSVTMNEKTYGYDVLAELNGKKVTLDLNGKTIRVTPNSTADLSAGIANCVEAVIFLGNGADLTITGNGDFRAYKGANHLYSVFYNSKSTLTIENGSFAAEELPQSAALIYADADNTTIIKDGRFSLINVGSYDSTKPWVFNVEGKNSGSFVQIKGGYFYKQNPYLNYGTGKDCEVAIPDGMFFEQITSGDMAGYWHLVDAVASVDGIGYRTLQEAIDDAADGATIELMRDAGIGLADKSLVIKRNGHSAKVAAMSGYTVVTDTNAYIVKSMDDAIEDATGAKLAYIDVNTAGYDGEELMSLTTALKKAKSGDTVKLTANLMGENAVGTVIIPSGVTLDIESHTLEADYIIGLNGSILTGKTVNASGIRGKVIVPEKNIALSSAKSATYLPILVDENTYGFAQMQLLTSGYTNTGFNVTENSIGFGFKHNSTATILDMMKEKGAAEYGMSIVLTLYWNVYDENNNFMSVAHQSFTYGEDFVKSVSNPANKKVFYLTIENYDDMKVDLGSLYAVAEVVTQTGAVAYSANINYNK